MNFEVGDKVKLVRMEDEADCYKKYLDRIFTVKKVYSTFVTFVENTEENIGPYLKNLELIKDYTYEDLKKSPIGTKITFENGEVLVKDDDGNYSNKKRWRDDSDLKELKDRVNTLGKITKIEEPTYKTVYEAKPEILNEIEKRYLRGVIRPFRDKVKTIRKTDNTMNGKDNEYLTITLKEEPNMDFPNFEPNTMYKGMELYKEYTLKELGL
mgnify:FL=1